MAAITLAPTSASASSTSSIQHPHQHRKNIYAFRNSRSSFSYGAISRYSHCKLKNSIAQRNSPRSSVSGSRAAPETAGAIAEAEEGQSSSAKAPLRLTYLEGNSWLWDVVGIQVLIDPILVGNLDFGIPMLYDAAKKELKEFKLEDLPKIDLLLITQNFDDHCHVKTLDPLSKMLPGLQVISTPNCESILSKLFKKVTYLEPGESTTFVSTGSELTIQASAGPVLGPPWQRPENGYFVKVKDPEFSVYFEPHCVYDISALENQTADVVITPVVKQVLPGFTLVSGQGDAVNLAKLLKAKVVVPMQNGDLDSKGILTKIVSSVGTVEEFKNLLQKEMPDAVVVDVKPGIPTDVPIVTY